MMPGIRKVLRFITLYGVRRTFTKVAGRLRIFRGRWRPPSSRAGRRAGLIGCGQFAFSTIGFFLRKNGKRSIEACFDIDPAQAGSFADYYGAAAVPTVEGVLNRRLDLVYVASNHHSHADYAVRAMQRGLDVYVEKPVCVNERQFAVLARTVQRARGKIYAGYNRPFSRAVLDLKKRVRPAEGPFSIGCFVSGHRIDGEHWYRKEREGTRICGNMGHWIDLTVHFLAWRSLPDRMEITVNWADAGDPDDNIAVTLVTELNDIATIMLSSRSEPFEGINETVHLQQGDVIAKIDDFRRMVIWKGPALTRKNYWPKDVGHENAILQPFGDHGREWAEVEMSTLLMLHVKNMVLGGRKMSRFSFRDARARIMEENRGAG